MSFSTLAGSLATLLGVAFIWPQVIRVYVRRSVEGVAPFGPLIGLSGTLMWFTYGIATSSVPMMLSNLNIEIAFIALMTMLVRKKALPLWAPLITFGVTSLFCLVAVQFSPTIVGVVGVIVGTPAIVPQLLRAIRTTHLYGVSVSSNVLLAMMGSCWFVYGITINDPVVSYPNLLMVPSASYIAWKAWSSHQASSYVNSA
jgi:uncharacterized protein with PQ loop repeat